VRPLKTCAKCKKELPATVEFFFRQARAKSGLKSRCKVCQQEDSNVYRLANPEKFSGYRAKAYKNDAEAEKKRTAKYRKDHPEKIKKYPYKNKPQYLRQRRAYYALYPTKRQKGTLKKNYRLTVEQYQAKLVEQNFRCANLGCSNSVVKGGHVDHDHTCCPTRESCGKCVRGILCPGCNTGLGMLKDDIARVRGAAAYLELHLDKRLTDSATERNTDCLQTS